MPVINKLARRLAAIARESLFLVRAYRAVKGLDVLVMSGGGQICELWGGAWAHPFNIFKFSVLARLARKRIYFLNVGAEPLEHPLSRLFVKSALRMAHYISFRDAYSKTVVRSLGLTREISVNHDCAYGLDVDDYLRKSGPHSARPIVALNPIGFCDPRIWPRKEEQVYRLYLEKLCKFGTWLLEQGYNIRLFTTSPRADSLAIADLEQQLLAAYSSKDLIQASTSDVVAPIRVVMSNTVKEVLCEISQCDYVVTSRYHGVVFSHLLRKPVIALGYQNKSDVAMEPLGLRDWSASIESFETEWLIEAFCRLTRTRETVKSQEESAVTGYAAALNKQFDSLFSRADLKLTAKLPSAMVAH